ncbi:phage tail protein [Nostoc edaphicum CCNP1411]|uniref:Phage tail protein n=1 Tax=Nostoc edaphicum CCNP1411 TaxID=1472755 RepID=A0A7D7QFR4_9NOSO|nr:phage tail protein [Nostoc edaphicum]QMS92059.1 phage tail protein [Nostoc edaphicum CCNP1411]
MNAKNSELISSYQQYLPTILQQDAFLGQLLLAFETILSGINETSNQEKIITPPALEEIIDNIHIYFNPQQTPEEFLPWLAGWVALSLRNDWQVEVKKAFIQQIVRLYRLRGTKQGLIEILGIYLKNSGFGEKVEVFDEFDNFPNYFQVQLTLKDRDPDKYWRQAKIAKAIIDSEKPAQTFYTLKILVPTMQLTKRSHVAYPFKLFEPLQNQKFAIEVIITPNVSNSSTINQLAKQLLVQLQGNSKLITPDSSKIIINNQYFAIKQDLNYQHFQENLTGFNVVLSNRTDKYFVGNLAIKLYFYINDGEYSNTLLEQSLNLSPVLKIYNKNNTGEITEGNTIFKQASQPQKSGMKITESIWSQPYTFQTFKPPKIQELQPQITAILEKIELEAIVEITQPKTITSDILNKITVRLQDDVSEFHLFTPETIRENNKITIKRTLYYQQFTQTIDRLDVAIKNLNNIDIVGKVTVQASLKINQRLSTYQLLEQTFNLTAVSPYNILEICRKNEEGQIISGNTILGTTSQSLN